MSCSDTIVGGQQCNRMFKIADSQNPVGLPSVPHSTLDNLAPAEFVARHESQEILAIGVDHKEG